MKIFKPKNENVDPEVDAAFRAKLEELSVASEVFDLESKTRMRRLHDQLEDAQHEYNVVKHEIKDEVAKGINKLDEAAEAIIFPEE